MVYKVNEFVQDAVSMRITPFMLDNYSQEFEEIKAIFTFGKGFVS
jgi:hypothetical protein